MTPLRVRRGHPHQITLSTTRLGGPSPTWWTPENRLEINRKQITFDYLDTVTGQVCRGQIAPADREHLRAWLARFAGRDDVAFALEGCAGWRYVAEELAGTGITAHLAEPADTAFARGRKRHAKTDKTDSRHLRMLLAEGRLPECWIPPAHILECRALLELYNDLRRERASDRQARLLFLRSFTWA